jgi:hypothetical protein
LQPCKLSGSDGRKSDAVIKTENYMKSLPNRRITASAWVFASCALLIGAVTAQSQTTNVYLDPSLGWVGFMNVFELPANGGAFVFNSAWGTAALPAVFNGSLLTIGPNVNTYDSTNDSFWVNPDGSGNKTCDASFYIQDDTLAGSTVTFSGYCDTNTLVAPYTCVAFIKDFASDFSSSVSATAIPVTGQTFSVTLATSSGDHIQYGFETIGPDANPATVASLGSVIVSSNAVVPPPPASPTNNAPTPTRPAFSVLSMYNSSGVYPNHPIEHWYASWSGANGFDYTIPQTGRVVKEYANLQFAGVEFYDTLDGDNVGGATDYSINASSYTTFHVDVWTPNANQLGIQLVSLNPTVGPQVDFLPASNTITSNNWISLDIPLSQFTATNSALVLSDLQQMLWIDNEAGGGVTGGIFYIDNVYFYNNAPIITAALSGGTISLSFPTQIGSNYTVQYRSHITDSGWQTLSTVSGTGQTKVVTDTANQTSRFYRLSIQ